MGNVYISRPTYLIAQGIVPCCTQPVSINIATVIPNMLTNLVVTIVRLIGGANMWIIQLVMFKICLTLVNVSLLTNMNLSCRIHVEGGEEMLKF